MHPMLSWLKGFQRRCPLSQQLSALRTMPPAEWSMLSGGGCMWQSGGCGTDDQACSPAAYAAAIAVLGQCLVYEHPPHLAQRPYTAGSAGGIPPRPRLCVTIMDQKPRPCDDISFERHIARDWDREEHELLKEQLLAGRSVCYRFSGDSMFPWLRNGDETTYDPVTSADHVMVDAIVFSGGQQPGSRVNAYLVKRKEWNGVEWIFTASNAEGRETGWCRLQHIYGRLVSIVDRHCESAGS